MNKERFLELTKKVIVCRDQRQCVLDMQTDGVTLETIRDASNKLGDDRIGIMFTPLVIRNWPAALQIVRDGDKVNLTIYALPRQYVEEAAEFFGHFIKIIVADFGKQMGQPPEELMIVPMRESKPVKPSDN